MSIRGSLVCLSVILGSLPHGESFVRSPMFSTHASKFRVASTVESPTTVAGTDAEAPLKTLRRERYVATNRFTVRKGKEAAFEKRWATRKSRLASLDGFKYFHVMRRVAMDDNEESFDDEYNYVSFTIWDDKKAFNAWRNGDAFVEAHGGSDIFSFLKTMISSSLVLTGPPKPAFYDGLLQLSTVPEEPPITVNGWRDVEADGVNALPTEAFVACNRFFVPEANAAAFEARWAQRESKLKECDGFVSFSMLRRDGKAKGHGVSPVQDGEASYQSTTIWRDKAAFEAWRSGNAFKQAHGQPTSPQGEKSSSEASAPPPKPLWSSPPKPVFYEAFLVITSPEGA